MQPPDHVKEIQKVLGSFSNFDPQAFEKLLRHLDAWTFEVTVAVTEAPSSDILTLQGRAQQMRKVMKTFAEVLDTKTAAP